jgi:RNA polymerase sigma-70 factor, ECF subfamily
VTERGDSQALLSAIAAARERFLDLVAQVRPELHRYCARMTGSVFDGEDVVQDTLAKAYFALAEMEEPPPLRPWLFRIAHNTAMDFLRRYERRNVDVVAEVPESASEERGADPGLVEAALAVFAALPAQQRSALALKDVLGHSLEETAATMGTTVAAVKSALVRARARVVASASAPDPEPGAAVSAEERDNLRRYAELFNGRDWDGLRQLFGDQARLDLVSRSQRRGPSAAQYCSRYAVIAESEQLSAQAGLIDGVPVIAMFRAGASRPAYFVQLVWQRGQIALVRDFHYVPYIAEDAAFTPA